MAEHSEIPEIINESGNDSGENVYAITFNGQTQKVTADLHTPEGREKVEKAAIKMLAEDSANTADAVEQVRARVDRLSRLTIMITPDEHLSVHAMIAALKFDPNLFQRSGSLVRTVRVIQDSSSKPRAKNPPVGRGEGSLIIAPMSVANLRERASECIVFERLNARKKKIQILPPPSLMPLILERKEWPGIRHLKGVSDTPVLRPDGSLCRRPGYDPETSVFYEPHATLRMPKISDKISRDDALNAVTRLREIVCDFQFEAPEHFSGWLAALLTVLARPTFDGPTPMTLFDANIRGAGKTMLAQTIGHIALGRSIPVASYVHKDSEMEKIVVGVGMAGDRIILLDNITGLFGNSIMDRLLTSDHFKGRALGLNENPEFQMSTVWLATGNNVALAGDICRRTIHVRIISEDEHPEHRSNFKHPNLISWLAENRGQFLADALTVLSGFLRSGATIKPTTAFGSYEGWSSVVRSAILWLDLPDPCLSQVGLAENSDSDTQILAQLLDAWEAYAVRHSLNHGALIPEILHGLYPNLPKDQWSNGPEDSALRASLEAITRSKPRQTPSAEEVGNRFRRFKGRFFGGKCLNHIGKRTNRGFVWGVINKKNPLFPTNNNGHSVTGAGSVASLFPTREKTQREGEFGGDQRSTPAPHTQPAQTFASDGAGGYAGEPDEVSEMSGGR